MHNPLWKLVVLTAVVAAGFVGIWHVQRNINQQPSTPDDVLAGFQSRTESPASESGEANPNSDFDFDIRLGQSEPLSMSSDDSSLASSQEQSRYAQASHQASRGTDSSGFPNGYAHAIADAGDPASPSQREASARPSTPGLSDTGGRGLDFRRQVRAAQSVAKPLPLPLDADSVDQKSAQPDPFALDSRESLAQFAPDSEYDLSATQSRNAGLPAETARGKGGRPADLAAADSKPRSPFDFETIAQRPAITNPPVRLASNSNDGSDSLPVLTSDGNGPSNHRSQNASSPPQLLPVDVGTTHRAPVLPLSFDNSSKQAAEAVRSGAENASEKTDAVAAAPFPGNTEPAEKTSPENRKPLPFASSLFEDTGAAHVTATSADNEKDSLKQQGEADTASQKSQPPTETKSDETKASEEESIPELKSADTESSPGSSQEPFLLDKPAPAHKEKTATELPTFDSLPDRAAAEKTEKSSNPKAGQLLPQSKAAPLKGEDGLAEHEETKPDAKAAATSERRTPKDVPPGPQRPNLSIEKTAPPNALLGKAMVYSITIKNHGISAAQGVLVEDQIPEGTDLIGTIPQAELYGTRLVWKIGTLRPNEEKKISVKVIPQKEGQIGSVATVSFVAEVAAETRITAPKLSLELTGPKKVKLGQQVMFQFQLRNNGNADATGIVLRNIIPDGLSHPDGNDLEYDVGTLPARSVAHRASGVDG